MSCANVIACKCQSGREKKLQNTATIKDSNYVHPNCGNLGGKKSVQVYFLIFGRLSKHFIKCNVTYFCYTFKGILTIQQNAVCPER